MIASKLQRRVFFSLVLLGFLLRLGYGVVRYRSRLFDLTGQKFITSWDFDALEQVLIAKALLSGKGYVVDDSPIPPGKHVRFVGQEALFKAPLYQFFLAGAFAISGFSFNLFFPLQALFGGLLSGLMGLIGLHVFQRSDAAWFAGAAAAAHPILVNAASQPYNEDIFFFFFAAAIWAFLVWFASRRLRWAVLCGAMIGLCMLTRENGVILLAGMAPIGLIGEPRRLSNWTGVGTIALVVVVTILPWMVRNYLLFGRLVPVADITGEAFVEGNNACVVSESVFVPYWAEGPCSWVNQQRQMLRGMEESDSRVPAVIRSERLSWHVGVDFVLDHPAGYAILAFRRLWTTLLPYDPRGDQHLVERIALSVYWLVVFPAGLAGVIRALKQVEAGRRLLGLLVILNLLSITIVNYYSDLRLRLGMDLLLGCFAGWEYAQVLRVRHSRRALDADAFSTRE